VKVVILAGGIGSRLQEETTIRPKPLVEVGGKPILWHILNIYSAFGMNEFVIALGYKGEVIKEYFLDYSTLNNDLTVDLAKGRIEVHTERQPRWIVDLVDTGRETLTGGRIRRVRSWIGEGTFMVTYGDGVADVRISELLDFHRSHGKIATLTAARPPARYGGVRIGGDGRVIEFVEKPQEGEGWISAGFFVLEQGIFDYIEGDDTAFEWEPMERLVTDGELMAYEHHGFFQPMDTIRDRRLLEEYWASGKAPWKMWSS
jgi:glucose-1-phosphate cytidylyltransferase